MRDITFDDFGNKVVESPSRKIRQTINVVKRLEALRKAIRVTHYCPGADVDGMAELDANISEKIRVKREELHKLPVADLLQAIL